MKTSDETKKSTAVTVKSTALGLAKANGAGVTTALIVKSVFGSGIDAGVVLGVTIALAITLIMLMIAAVAGDE